MSFIYKEHPKLAPNFNIRKRKQELEVMREEVNRIYCDKQEEQNADNIKVIIKKD